MFALARNLGVVLDEDYRDPLVAKMHRDIA